MIDLIEKEAEVLSGLKDFQKATVERVHHLFTNNYTRVLVADEVGLGKTMVARGVIAKSARYHRNDLKDDLFKVVYVCSNQSIAGQNLEKLKIDQRVRLEGASETRLSMQHLKLYEDQFDPKLKEQYIQLIPLTPLTSFKMTSGGGSVFERALMYSVLQKYRPLQPHLAEFDILMMDKAEVAWNHWKKEYENRVENCDSRSRGAYLHKMLEQVDKCFRQDPSLMESIQDVCDVIRRERIPGKRVEGALHVIYRLRRMMAEISVDLMDADLVIMDEFQRFPELVNADSDSETALLARKFFNSSDTDENKVKILLLSATPYKPYSTLEELSETGSDEHYKEFMQVTDFLFKDHPDHQRHFQTEWREFSESLRLFTHKDFTVIRAKKQEAEESLYKGIVRTERMNTNGINASVAPVDVTEHDVTSYMNMDSLLQDIGLKNKVPVDYVKSAPFLMSFMEQYKLKHKITDYFRNQPEEIAKAKKSDLWIERNAVNRYKKLPETNARLSRLKEAALPKNAEKLMWIPPSLPYYESGGCFTGHRHFSKVLVFSQWEMVPRAIATMLSYEAERLTVGELINRTPGKKKKGNRRYFAERRFPQPRLTFSMKRNEPTNMNHLTLIYPSVTLARLFDPVDVLNRKLSLKEIKAEIREEIQSLLGKLPHSPGESGSRADEKWYYMAPLLMDLEEEAVQDWLDKDDLLPRLDDDTEENSGEDQAALAKHLEVLRSVCQQDELPVLGDMPDDLEDVLVDMALGSPAVCAVRMLGEADSEALPLAIHLAKTIMDRFNTQEAISYVELEYGRNKKERRAHWQNVLKYCVDGNIQAMLDEYAHMLLEEGALDKAAKEWRNQELIRIMSSSLKTHSASYNVDSYQGFRKRISTDGRKKEDKDSAMRIRTNYAVGFADQRNETHARNRKRNVRLAFNSPFRPFVLASTSIGQEGLDFHYYCRKVVHWNLPSNPVQLEQREGRVNRYKGLAIRQNIADKYENLSFEADVWKEMFQAAKHGEGDQETSDLVPFWSLPDHQAVQIERIVPAYPHSLDFAKYERLIKILALYRLSLGQPRQEELLESLFHEKVDEDQLKDLFMNLSPFYKGVR